SSSATTLGDVLKQIKYGIYAEPNYQAKGIPFLRALNLKEYGIEDEILNLAESVSDEVKNYLLKEGDVLIVRSGAGVGDVGLITTEFVGATFGSYTILLRVDNKRISPEYLYAFLKSKFGRIQTERLSRGAAQPNLNIPMIKSIKIPLTSSSFQSHIESLVRTAHEKRKEAQRKLQEAEEILEKELGWRELELNHDKAFEASFSHLERRFDPEYFKPRYEKIKEVLLLKDAKSLSEAVKVITKRADFRKTPDKTIKYVAIADVDPESSQIVSYTEMPAYQAPSRATYEIREGYILTATSGNSTGTKRHASCFVTAKEDGFICTNGLVPLQPKEDTEPLYLLFYLKSPFFLEQVKRELTGAAIPAISLEDLKQVLVYLPESAIQKEIAKLVEMSNHLRTESRNLIEQAKKEVEKMIERYS
ncbi:MAG: restriction endonuclease subunit S, partial [Nitrospirota bacterium]